MLGKHKSCNMTDQKISDRLRALKDQQGWTAQQMADATGMSRRTLESYMKRENAAQPGLEALCQIARGLGVSLDWLAGVGDMARIRDVLIARVSAERASLPVLTTLISTLNDSKPAPAPEFMAMQIGAQAAQLADAMHQSAITSVQMAERMKSFEDEAEVTLRVERDRLREEIERLEDAGKALRQG